MNNKCDFMLRFVRGFAKKSLAEKEQKMNERAKKAYRIDKKRPRVYGNSKPAGGVLANKDFLPTDDPKDLPQ